LDDDYHSGPNGVRHCLNDDWWQFRHQYLLSYMMGFMFRDDGRVTVVAFVIMLTVLLVMIWSIV
jgi:fumarate reductase subunit C